MAKNSVTRHQAQTLPVPPKLEPKVTKRSLMERVRGYFYQLWNEVEDSFRVRLGTVGNADSVTGIRMFDRYEATDMIKKAGKDAKDPVIISAMTGDIYRCVVRLLRAHDMGLKLRREQYRQLTHTPAAE